MWGKKVHGAIFILFFNLTLYNKYVMSISEYYKILSWIVMDLLKAH